VSLDRLVELSLVAIPSLIFIVLVAYLRRATNEWPAEKTGFALAYFAAEGTSALFLLLAVAVRPALIIDVGEFRGMLVIFALRTAWSAFRTIVSELDGAQA
jgi:hypothetical protein